MTYEWKAASHIKTDAQAAGKVCEELERSGGLTPKRLVDASRPPGAPLHREFEWDDTQAAELYREHQAGHIIRCLVVAPESPKEEPIRAYFPVTARTEYTHITKIVTSEDLKHTMLDRAMRELAAYRAKYASLKELKAVFSATDQALAAYNRSRTAPRTATVSPP